MLLIGYQNFSTVDPKGWDSTRSLEIIQEMNTFNEKDLHQKPNLAQPQSGADFNSVRNDWVQRQSQILLNGLDKEIENSLNNTLNSWIENLNSEKNTTQSSSEQPTDSSSQAVAKNKQNLRFASINALKYDLSTNSSLDFIATPGDSRLNYSQSFRKNTKFGIEHRAANSQTQMFLKYEY